MLNEKKYDNLFNEGGEGYNPYRTEREQKENEIKRPRTRDDILRELQSLDCSLARESGTYNPEKIKQLQDELSELEHQQNEKFLLEWTAEVTQARRENWNEMVRSGKFGNGKVDWNILRTQEKNQGWTMEDMKKAVTLNGLEKC